MHDHKLYLQIYEYLMSDILNSKYSYGDKLPSLTSLCETFHVGRNTMRSALLLLEDRGFIKNQRGSKAIVVFNINEMESQRMYKTAIYERKQAYEEIFQLLLWWMPELIAELKKRTGKEELVTLINKVNDLYADTNHPPSQQEFTDKFYGILKEAIALFDNTLLDTLFLEILHFLYLPIPLDNQSQRLSYVDKLVSEMLPRVANFLLTRNDYMLKRMISFIMQALIRSSMGYVDRIGNGIEITEYAEFKWQSSRNLDLHYMNTVISIIHDIHIKRYTKSLPSLQQLSENYNTSLRTVRKACDLLDDYKIIQKSNGLKSKIIINDIHDPRVLIANKKVKANIIMYKNALQIILIMAKGLNRPILSACNNEEISSFIESVGPSKYVLSNYLHFIFTKSNAVIAAIYEELNKSLAWNIYSDTIFNPKLIPYDFFGKSQKFVKSLSKRKYDEIDQYLNEISQIVEGYIHQLITHQE